MATFNLTQNIDALTGGTGNDAFNAPLFVTGYGTLAATLQTTDAVDGGAGNDVLNATLLADASAPGQAYYGRPILTNIEALSLTSISNLTAEGDAAQSKSTIDLLKSSGITSLTSADTNNQLDITNAGAITTYSVMNSDADDPEDGLIVTGITATALTVKAINVTAEGMDTETLSFATKSGADLASLALAMNNAQIVLNGGAAALKLTSNGPALNDVHFIDDGKHTTIMATGAAALHLSSDNPFAVATSFDASAMTGALTVDQAITGSLSSVKGSQGNDLFHSIQSSGVLHLDTANGNDIVTVTTLTAGVANSLQLGAGNDSLDISGTPIDFATDTHDVFDGGTGTDTLRAQFINGFSAAQATQLKNFEALDLAAGSRGAFDMTAMPAVTQITAENNAGELYFQNVANSSTFTIEGNSYYHIDLGTHDTASNAIKLIVGTPATAANSSSSNQGTVFFPDIYLNESGNHAIETVSISSQGGALAPAIDAPAGNFSGSFDNIASDFNLVRLDNQAGTTTVNISGNEDLQLRTTVSTTSVVTTLNAGALTGALDLTAGFNSGETYLGFKVSDAGATITGGHGNDYLIGGAGADSFKLVAGGKDQIDYRLQSDSDFATGQSDTISNFTSGDDKLAFNGAHSATGVFQGPTDVTGVLDFMTASGSTATDGVITLDFLGNASNFMGAQNALTTFHGADTEDYAAMFDKSTSTLYIDSNHDGALTSADMAITMTSNAAGLAATDLIIA